jgi:GNAT superfamily N-acetyltransferase
MTKKKAHPTEKPSTGKGLRLDDLKYEWDGGKLGTPYADKERFYHPSLTLTHELPPDGHESVSGPNKEVVGRLNWHGTTGAINMIEVHPQYRGLKVATHMLELAKKQSSIMGVPEPTHSDLRTVGGDAWAKSTGMGVPPIRSGVCRDCSELRKESGECSCTDGPQHMRIFSR